MTTRKNAQQGKDKKSDGKSAGHADLSKARDTVNRIRHHDPPQASTSTEPNASGRPVSDFKPPQKNPKTKAPPKP